MVTDIYSASGGWSNRRAQCKTIKTSRTEDPAPEPNSTTRSNPHVELKAVEIDQSNPSLQLRLQELLKILGGEAATRAEHGNDATRQLNMDADSILVATYCGWARGAMVPSSG